MATLPSALHHPSPALPASGKGAPTTSTNYLATSTRTMPRAASSPH